MTRFKFGILVCMFFLLVMLPVFAQDTDVEDESSADDEITLTDEEIDALLKRVDRFYFDQDMAGLTVDVDILRDPANRLNEDNIRDPNPGRLAGLSTIISHYSYNWPGFYQLKVMGQVLASSELPPDQTFFSQILPLPGAPIYSDDIKERFRIEFQGVGEVDGVEAYMIRYNAIDRETEFFNYLTHYISIEEEILLRVESSFDNYWYVGSGSGNYYYDHWLGKHLPIYGHGTVTFLNPVRRFNVWGRWYRWDWQTAEELGYDATTGELIEPIPEEPEIIEEEVIEEEVIEEEIIEEEVTEENENT